MKILTGIDLAFEPSCGSLILCDDIYSQLPLGNEVRFLSLKSQNISPEWSNIPEIKTLDVVKVTNPKEYGPYISKLKSLIDEEISDFQPDIIHIQHLSFGMALAFSQIASVPKIAICHGTDILYSINNEFHRNNVIQICNSADSVIFPTSEMYNDFKRIIGRELGDKVKIVYWGIPREPEITFEPGNNLADIKLLYAGRLTQDKGVDIILKAVSNLPVNFKLTIIGSGDFGSQIVALSRELGIENQVNFIDFLPRKDLWNEFKKYDALIVSTREIESFCLVAVEAQSHGLPVIYSATSGLKEVIGDSGIGFTPQDSMDLKEKIQLLFNNGLKDEYVQRSLNNANRYTINRTISAILRLSNELIAGKMSHDHF